MEVHILSSGTRKILLLLFKFFVFGFTQINDVLLYFFLLLSMLLITLFCTLLCSFVLLRLFLRLFLHTSNARYLISVIFFFLLFLLRVLYHLVSLFPSLSVVPKIYELARAVPRYKRQERDRVEERGKRRERRTSYLKRIHLVWCDGDGIRERGTQGKRDGERKRERERARERAKERKRKREKGYVQCCMHYRH